MQDTKLMRYLCRMDLKAYIEKHILPQYLNFDKAHGPEHVHAVIERSLSLARHYGLDSGMVYVAAAYHDTGLVAGRERHHLVSGEIIRNDLNLRQWFSEEQIETIAQAAEDHRASAGKEPRSIYGRIIAEADRQIDPELTIRRTILYGLSHYPEMDKEGHWRRMVEHLRSKYAEGGYLKLLIPESDNAARLQELRKIINDEVRLREIFEREFAAAASE